MNTTTASSCFSFKLEEIKDEMKEEEASEVLEEMLQPIIKEEVKEEEEEEETMQPRVEMIRLSEEEISALTRAQRVEVSTISRGSGSRYFFRKKVKVTIFLT